MYVCIEIEREDWLPYLQITDWNKDLYKDSHPEYFSYCQHENAAGKKIN